MRNSRAKSCDHCRAAKTRCSLSSPCSRCAKRCLQCQYSPPRSLILDERRLRKGFRPILPVNSTPIPIEKTVENGDTPPNGLASLTEAPDTIPLAASTAVPFSNISSQLEGNGFVNIATLPYAGTNIADLSVYQSDTAPLFDTPVASDFSHELTSVLGGSVVSNNSSGFPYHIDPMSTLRPLNFTPPPNNLGLSVASTSLLAYSSFSSSRLLMTGPHQINGSCKPYLSTRERSLQQGSLTAKMLLSQLIDYTHRMADGKHLPPFIYPPCSLSQHDECPPDTPHTCLPETLAICRSLTQMFYSRTPGSSGYIWQQICTHLRQMHAEVSSLSTAAILQSIKIAYRDYFQYQTYDKENMLQALQAAIIYGLLYSQCREHVASEDVEWLVTTAEVCQQSQLNASTDAS